MADVTLTYKGSDILELSDSGSATLKTGGTYCEADIELEYVKPSGGGSSLIDYVTSGQSLFNGKTIPEKAEINFLFATNLDSAFRGTDGVKDIVLSSENNITNLTTFSYDSSVEKIDFSGLKTANFNFNGAFWNCINLTDIVGLNLKGATNVTNLFTGCNTLKNLTIAENCCSINISYSSCSLLTDESLIGIANSLIYGSNTITLAQASKTRSSAITGTVSQKTDEDSNAYDFFTADANGTVTLMDFITNTKGWTVA